jgi:hypothetical protein
MIVSLILFQGCTAGGYIGGKIKDISTAPVEEECSLNEISEGDYIEFLLKNDNVVRGKVKELESEKYFTVSYLTKEEHLKKTMLMWRNIQAAHRLDVDVEKRTIRTAIGFSIDTGLLILYIIAR